MIKNVQEEQEYQNIYESDDYKESDIDSRYRSKNSPLKSINPNEKRIHNDQDNINLSKISRGNKEDQSLIKSEDEEAKIANFELFFPDFYDVDLL